MGIQDCKLIELPKVSDPRGNLTFIEGARHIPFEIARIYYLYDVPGGAHRAGHAHKTLRQVLVALSGSFDITVDDGRSQTKYHLNRPYQGLYIPAMIWRVIDNFSSGAVCLALASNTYDESEYYREYETFLQEVRIAGQGT
jgi:oxalate decarboxylase/phosphoglucose isomerase-like protein (cupin superfamily)